MIIVLENGKWFDEQKLEKLPIFDRNVEFYKTPTGNYIGAMGIYTGENPYFHVTEENHPEYYNLIMSIENRNPGDEL